MSANDNNEPVPRPAARKNDIIDPAVSKSCCGILLERIIIV